VVDAEMDLQSAGTYTERVRAATRILRVDGRRNSFHHLLIVPHVLVLPQFATKAENAVKLLLSGNSDAKVDIDEFIDAASLVHEAVRNIREALLLNRNAEDIDSDNEYIDDTGRQYLSALH
jgi:catenin alpha